MLDQFGKEGLEVVSQLPVAAPNVFDGARERGGARRAGCNPVERGAQVGKVPVGSEPILRGHARRDTGKAGREQGAVAGDLGTLARAGPRAAGWGAKEEWRIVPVRHGTLRGVLEEWTARAGGTLVWEAEEVDYALQAPAVYLGTFDAAVDALLRETKGRRMLVPTLWRANRYLTVREAG